MRYLSVACLTFAFLGGFTHTICAQQLARRGSLGVAILELNDSLRILSGAENGIFVNQVMPGGTADGVGLQDGDVLTAINGTPLDSRKALFEMGGNWTADAPISFDVIRKGRKENLTGKVKGKPMETSSFGEVIYDAVPFQQGHLRCIIHKPSGDGPFPTVIYLQGYTCGSIDYYFDPSFTVKQLVDGLVEQGYAVLRVEKPGVGDSEGTSNCLEIGYQEEIKAFDTALDYFTTYDFVDASRIFYFGHSLGGIAAPILAVDHQPQGVIVFGTVAKSWYEYLMDLFRDQNFRTGADPIETETNMRLIMPLLYEYIIEKKSPDQLREDPKMLAAFSQLGIDGEQVLNRHYTFWQELQEYDLTAAWKNAAVPTLALYGEHDIQAINAEGAKMIAQIVNAYHPGLAEWQVVTDTEHAMAKVPSMEEYVKMRAEGRFNRKYMGENFNKELVTLITAWIESVEAKQTNR